MLSSASIDTEHYPQRAETHRSGDYGDDACRKQRTRYVGMQRHKKADRKKSRPYYEPDHSFRVANISCHIITSCDFIDWRSLQRQTRSHE
jgi:hypothetical protein